MPPIDVMQYGRMAVYLDQAGAAFASWEPGTHLGADVFNVPGALTWNQLMTRDQKGSEVFYREVFDWVAEDDPQAPGPYMIWNLNDRPIGGMMPMAGNEWPPELTSHWMTYFAVADADATAAKAASLGAAVPMMPSDLPVGRFAVINDPHGTVFAVIARTDPAME